MRFLSIRQGVSVDVQRVAVPKSCSASGTLSQARGDKNGVPDMFSQELLSMIKELIAGTKSQSHTLAHGNLEEFSPPLPNIDPAVSQLFVQGGAPQTTNSANVLGHRIESTESQSSLTFKAYYPHRLANYDGWKKILHQLIGGLSHCLPK